MSVAGQSTLLLSSELSQGCFLRAEIGKSGSCISGSVDMSFDDRGHMHVIKKADDIEVLRACI